MKRSKTLLACAVIMMLVIIDAAYADVPEMINYQGRLTDDQGEEVNGLVSLTFTIYNQASGGTVWWSETHPDVQVAQGLFTVILGETVPIDDSVFTDSVRYLGIKVGGDAEIEPRTRLLSTGYSHRVSTVDGATGGIISGDLSIQSDLAVSGNLTIGWNNTNVSNYQIVAGEGNTVGAFEACVLGGGQNSATGSFSVVAGGGGEDEQFGNVASGDNSSVSGGKGNIASGDNSCVGGGRYNLASGACSRAGGGSYNKVRGDYSVVAGGGGSDPADSNVASGSLSVVSGGSANKALHYASVIAGGIDNSTTDMYGVIGGGRQNTAGDFGVVAGGGGAGTADGNHAGDHASIGGGNLNNATGTASVIPGGLYNTASGYQSFAAGFEATASHEGSFVWNDYDFEPAGSDRDNQFKVAADGGVRLEVNNGEWFDFRYIIESGIYHKVFRTSTDAYLSAGGTWTSASSRDKKENFTSLDRFQLLEKLAALPITRWNYKNENENITHIGPVAEDFHAAFGVGEDKGIAAIDEAGIALAAIQELHRKNTELEAEVAELKALVERLLEER